MTGFQANVHIGQWPHYERLAWPREGAARHRLESNLSESNLPESVTFYVNGQIVFHALHASDLPRGITRNRDLRGIGHCSD